MTREEFDRWRDNPITHAVMRAHKATADRNRDAWIRQSWDNGQANPLSLLELRTRADAYMAIIEMTYEGVCEANGEEPSDE